MLPRGGRVTETRIGKRTNAGGEIEPALVFAQIRCGGYRARDSVEEEILRIARNETEQIREIGVAQGLAQERSKVKEKLVGTLLDLLVSRGENRFPGIIDSVAKNY